MVDFKAPITTLDQGKAWIEALEAADMMFHFEDSPDDITRGNTGLPLFDEEEAKDVRKRVEELYALDWSLVGEECPIGYALTFRDPDWKNPDW